MKISRVSRILINFVLGLLLVCCIIWIYISINVKVQTLDDHTVKKNKTHRTFDMNQNQDDFFSRVVYNRVGKCGSRSMQSVISVLSKSNGFSFHISHIFNQTRLPILDLKTEINLIRHLEPPMLYSRHIHYINFEKFGVAPPVYINMIRDPIARFSSQYHYKRYGDVSNPTSKHSKGWKEGEKDLSINDCVMQNHTECAEKKLWYIVPYFCGQEKMCGHPSTYSLNRAKQHLLDNYLAVGILEDFEGTLKLFERLLPYHFKGAMAVWKNIRKKTVDHTSTVSKEPIRSEVYNILRDRMALEYEFYKFAVLLFESLKAQVGVN